MKTRSSILKIFLTLTLALGSFAVMPASTASASTSASEANWNACGGKYAFGTNKYGQGWVIANVSNNKCQVTIQEIKYIDYKRNKRIEGPSAWGQSAGITTKIPMRKGEYAHVVFQVWSLKYRSGYKKVDIVISR